MERQLDVCLGTGFSPVSFSYFQKRCFPNIKGKIQCGVEGIIFSLKYTVTRFSLWHALIRMLRYFLYRIYVADAILSKTAFLSSLCKLKDNKLNLGK